MAPGPPAAALQLLALGDSYTIGESVSIDERWPEQLLSMLRAQGLTVVPPTIVAQTGWTASELLAALDTVSLRAPYDLVTLLIGVNDAYRGHELGEFRTVLQALVQHAVALAGGAPSRVIVVAIPDWSVTPFAEGRDRARIRAEIDAFNAVNRQAALAVGTRYVDIATASRRAAKEPDLVASDGLHPSGKMYDVWARLILPAGVAALGCS